MRIRVLIVDDALFMRNMIKEVFSGNDFEVVGEAGNGVEAVERYKKEAAVWKKEYLVDGTSQWVRE